MPNERPVLTANWTELLLLNFVVPAALVARLAPAGTEPDVFDGQAYASIVGFRFHKVRLFGVAVPGHSKFTEINLRYYVRRVVDGELRRGVVFVKEIAPRRAVAAIANWLYNENYCTRPMRTNVRMATNMLGEGDTIDYSWWTGRRLGRWQRSTPVCETGWNKLAARVAGPLRSPAAGSFEEFIVENYWGYVRGRDGRTREYRVVHEPWKVARADNVVWNCDLVASYDAPWTDYLATAPVSALVADGSAVQLFRGRRI